MRHNLAAAVLLAAAATTAHAQTTADWVAVFGGSFQSPGNWAAGVVPGPADNARFNLGSNGYTVTFAADATNNQLLIPEDNVRFNLQGSTYTLTAPTNNLQVGFGGTIADPNVGNLTIMNGTVVTQGVGTTDARIAAFQQRGSVTVTGPAATWNYNGLIVGNNGEGTLNVLNGGTVSGNFLRLGGSGVAGAGPSMINVTGPGSTLTAATDFLLGTSHQSQLNVTGGGTVNSGTTGIGQFSFTSAEATVSGVGSTWTSTGTITVGADADATGTLSIEDGGQVGNVTGVVGNQVANTGTVTVTGADSAWTNSGTLTVGFAGSGTLDIEGGAAVTSGGGIIGRAGGSDGDVTLSDPGSTWTVNGNLGVGGDTTAGGDGSLTINTGTEVVVSQTTRLFAPGTINLDGGTFRTGSIQDNGGAFNWTSGTLNITGPQGVNLGQNAIFPAVTTLAAGQRLVIDNTLTVDATDVLRLTGGNASAGTIALDGGTILGTTLDLTDTGNLVGNGLVAAPVFGTSTATTIAATGTLAFGSLGTTDGFDFAGTLNVGSNQVIVSDADRAHLGAQTTLAAGGRLGAINGFDLAGGSLSATGSARIDGDFTNNGIVSGPSAAGERLAFTGDVNGAGSYAGNILFSDAFAPGNSPAIVPFGGNLTLDASSTTEIELFGLAAGEFDRIEVAGTLDFGGTLEVVAGGGFMPLPGDAFEIFTFASRTGDFDIVTDSLGLVGLDFELVYDADSATLLPTRLLDGDANFDGTVDLADFTLLRNQFGQTGRLAADFDLSGTVSLADFTALRNNFGSTLAGDLLGDLDSSFALMDAWAATVPEPGVAMSLLGLSALGLRRRVK
jgi:T5SS/PEP-CTERM-associated repeat protein